MCERLVIDDIVHRAEDYKVTAYSTGPCGLQTVYIADTMADEFTLTDE